MGWQEIKYSTAARTAALDPPTFVNPQAIRQVQAFRVHARSLLPRGLPRFGDIRDRSGLGSAMGRANYSDFELKRILKPLLARFAFPPSGANRRFAGRNYCRNGQSPTGFGSVSLETDTRDVLILRRYSLTSCGLFRATPAANTSTMAAKTRREAEGL